MSENFEIVVTDKIDPSVAGALRGIAEGAKRGGQAVAFLRKEISSLNTSAVNQLANAYAKMTLAANRQLAASSKQLTIDGKLLSNQAKQQQMADRAAVAKQRLTVATARAAQEEQKYVQQIIRTQQVQERLERQQRSRASSRPTGLSANLDTQFGIGSGANVKARAQDIAAYGRELDKAANSARKFGRSATEIEAQLGKIGAARRVGAIDAQEAAQLEGQALDRLRQQYDPLYAAQQQYRRTLSEIATAERLGALSTDAVTAARMRAKQVLHETTRAFDGGTRSVRLHAHQLQNLGFQLNDIVVGLASGQKPLTVLTQQGFQIAQIFGPGSGGVLTIMKEIAGILGRVAVRVAPFALGITAGSLALGRLNKEAKRLYDAKLQDEFKKYANSAKDLENITVTMGDTFKATFLVLADEINNATGGVLPKLWAGLGFIKDVVLDAMAFATERVVVGVTFIGKAMGLIYNKVALELENMIRNTLAGIVTLAEKSANAVITALNRFRDEKIELVDLSSLKPLEVQTYDLSTALEQAWHEADSFSGAWSRMGDAIIKKSGELARNRQLDEFGKNIKDNAKSLQDALDDMQRDETAKKMTRDYNTLEMAMAKVDAKVADLTRQYGPLSKAQKQQIELTRQLAKENVAYEELRDLVKETRTPIEEVREEMARMERLRPFAGSDPKFLEAIRRKIADIQSEINPMAQVFKDFASDIGGQLSEAFGNFYRGNKGGWNTFLDSLYDSFANMLGRMTMLAIAKPIIIPVVSAAAGALGLPDGVTQAIGSEFGLSDLATAGSTGFNLLGGLSKPIFAPGSAIGGAIDSVGNFFGIGPSPGFVGPMPLGQGGLSTAFTPAAGLAGFGGNFLANMLLGNRGIGATIGGAAGGIAGTATGGATLGTALGAAGGPIGALIGSFLGNALGGLFGNNKPASKAQFGTYSLEGGQFVDRGGFTGKKFSQENYDFVTGMGDLVGSIAKILGNKGDVRLEASNVYGLNYELNGAARKTFDDPGQFIKNLIKDLNESAPKINKSLQTALEKIDFSNVKENFDQIISDINFAFTFDNLGEVKEEVSAVKQQFDELNKTFDEAAATARRLGLDEKKVEEARKKLIQNIRDTVMQNTRNSIFDLQLDGFSELLALEKQYKQDLKDARLLGIDTALITKRYQLEVQQVMASNGKLNVELMEKERYRLENANQLIQRYMRIDQTFDDLLFKLRYGEFAPTDPVTRLGDLRGLVTSVGNQARLGNPDAQEELANIIPEFVRLSEEVNGSNAIFAADLRVATDLADQTKTVAQRQLEIQTQIAASAQTQITLLEDIASGKASVVGGALDSKYFSGDFSEAGNAANSSKTNANRVLVRAMKAGAINEEEFIAIQRAAGFYGSFGKGRAFQFFEDNTAANKTLLDIINSMGLNKYATGGFVTGGVQGKDSVPSMLMPGEYVLRERAVSSLGSGTVAYMNATGKAPSNDNAALAELNGRVEGLTRMLAVAMTQLLEINQRTARATEATASETKLKAWSN